MKVFINEAIQEVGDQDSLSLILDHLDLKVGSEKKGIAVAVNNEVITRDQWGKYYPKENSKIIIITATQGG